MNRLKYTIYLSILTFAGCSIEPPQEETPLESKNILTIAASAPSISATKSEEGAGPALSDHVVLGEDIIYAYPFNLSSEQSALTGVAIEPYLINTNYYSYITPETKQDLLFTNIISDSEYNCTTSAVSPYLTVTFAENTGNHAFSDFVIGCLPETSIVEFSDEQYPIHLQRAVSQVNISVIAKKNNNDEYVDFSTYYKKLEVKIPTYASYSISSFSEEDSGSYSGSTETSWTKTFQYYEEEFLLASNTFLFPSTNYESENATISLILETRQGEIQTLTRQMGQSIKPNNSYNLTLTLRTTLSDYKFTIDNFDVIDETVIL